MRWGHATAIALLALVSARGARADFSFIYNGHTYQLVQENRTWIAATAQAKGRSIAGSPGYLVEINDSAENAEIISRLLANIAPAQFNATRAPDG